MSQIDELKQLAIEADQRGDIQTANAAMDKIEELMAGTEQTAPQAISPTEPLTGEWAGAEKFLNMPSATPLARDQPRGKEGEAFDEASLSIITGATTGALGYVYGSIEGIIDSIQAGKFGTQEGVDIAAENALKRSGQLTFTPRTEGGQRKVRKFAETLAPLQAINPATMMEMATLSQISRTINSVKPGTRLLDDAGRPTAALEKALNKKGLMFDDLTQQAKSIIPANAERGILSKAKDLSKIADDTLKEQIRSGATTNTLAKVRLVGDKIVDDPIGIYAVKQGFSEGGVSAIKSANRQTKGVMREMTSIRQQLAKNEAKAIDLQPTDPIGKVLDKRVRFIEKKMDGANSRLKYIANNDLKGRPVNTFNVTNRLAESLKELNILPGKKGLDYSNSVLGENRVAQNTINKLVDMLSRDKKPDAYRAHILKRQLDDMIDFRKQSGAGLTENARNVLKNVRNALNESIREVHSQYAKVNDMLHNGIDAIQTLDDATKSVQIHGETAYKSIGNVLRRMSSRAVSRQPIIDAVDRIDSVVRDFGGKTDVSIKDLSTFANTLEKRFGSTADTSFLGQIQQANIAERTIRQGPRGAAFEFGAKKAGEAYSKVRRINDENAYKSLYDLLNRKD